MYIERPSNLQPLLACFLLAGCILPTSAGSVPYDYTIERESREGVILGKVGFPSRTGDALLGATLLAVDADEKKWSVPLQPELSQDGGNSAPFMVRLPAGRYQLTKLELEYTRGTWTFPNMNLTMDVEPALISCAGAVYIRGQRVIDGEDNGGSRLGVRFVIEDECAGLRAVFSARAPHLPPQTTVRLFAPVPVAPPRSPARPGANLARAPLWPPRFTR